MMGLTDHSSDKFRRSQEVHRLPIPVIPSSKVAIKRRQNSFESQKNTIQKA
jgi:hypothetical protein